MEVALTVAAEIVAAEIVVAETAVEEIKCTQRLTCQWSEPPTAAPPRF
jgi:hypothetical protein